MAEDESQTKEAPKINIVITRTQEEKGSLQPIKRSAVERARAKKQPPEQIKAERLFNQYCKPKSVLWEERARRQAAIAIISSGIVDFEEAKLRGHPRLGNFAVNWDDLISLWYSSLYYNVTLQTLHRDISREFDEVWGWVASSPDLVASPRRRLKKSGRTGEIKF